MKEKKAISPNFIAMLLLTAFLLLAYLSVLGSSPTYDEIRNYNYGKSILDGDSSRPDGSVSVIDGVPFHGSKMPINLLNALPFKIASVLPDSGFANFLKSNTTARSITIIFSLLTALLVFHWSKSLFGSTAALFSLLLYTFDPNLIAHSQLVTNDAFTWGTILAVFYTSWKFASQRTRQNGILWGIALGISSLAKYTTVILLPLSILCIFTYDIYISKQNKINLPYAFKQLGINCAISITLTLLIINMGFLFNNTFSKFGDYHFYSRPLNSLQHGLPWIKNMRVPVPYPYLEGLDLTYYYGEEGLGYGNVYMLGQIGSKTEGFRGYYFIASLFKTPLAAQFIIFFALLLYILQPTRRKFFFERDIFLLLPISFFGLYFNFLFNVNIGIRYYLIIFPLLYVFCGSLFQNWDQFPPIQKYASYFLAIYLIVSNLTSFPNYIPYFNELVWDKKQAYKYLADSNIDYGQSDYARDDFLAAHPDAIYNPAHPVSGTVVVGVNELVGVFGTADDYRWLRENFEPANTIANTYLIYEITSEQIDELCKKTDYCE